VATAHLKEINNSKRQFTGLTFQTVIIFFFAELIIRICKHINKTVYLPDAGQRKHNESAANKGRGLKIGYDHKLAKYIENKIKKEKWSPDVVIGRINIENLTFKTTICTKTLYNYIDKDIFAEISNKDLWVKKAVKKEIIKK